jgi:hypothetical protein
MINGSRRGFAAHLIQGLVITLRSLAIGVASVIRLWN